MKRKYMVCLLAFLIVTVFFTNSLALVEWDIQKILKMEASPLDIAVSKDGKSIFVLTESGDIIIYSSSGKLMDKIDVGNHVDQIKVGPREDLLFLSSRKNKTVEILVMDFIRNIDITGAPFKGPVDAPVVIAVFSDFQ